MDDAEKYILGPKGEKRLKGVQFTLPVVTGTIAFYLGKKATDYQTHKWIVYLRSPINEDLTHVFKKVTFELHSSFQNPLRDIEYQPYELTEAGWGEFDITIRLHFHDDAMEAPVELYHRLRLYDENGNNNAKKPVVFEVYEDVVFWQPTETFFTRVMAHQAKPAPPSSISQYWTTFNAEADYRRVQHARQRVAQITANVKAQLAAAEAEERGMAPA